MRGGTRKSKSRAVQPAKVTLIFCLITLVVLSSVFSPSSAGEERGALTEGDTTVIPIIGIVENNVRNVMTGVKEAVENESSAIVLLIDTPGGSIDATRFVLQNLNAVVDEQDVELIAYIRGDLFGGARSAGAFIAFACHEIYMEPDSYIGASQMVMHTEEFGMVPIMKVAPAGEKIQADHMAFFRARAQQRGQPYQVMEGMALENAVIWAKHLDGDAEFHRGEQPPDEDPLWEKIKPAGQILALTATEMNDYGIAQPGPPSGLKSVVSPEELYQKVKEKTIRRMITPEGWDHKVREVEIGTPGGVEREQITYFEDPRGIEFVWVPPGDYIRGEDRDAHEVEITQGFWISRTPVTQAQYEKVMDQNPSHFEAPDWPVDSVTWHEAVEFTEKLTELEGRTYRLPTEAEWEYAARAGSKTEYYFGHDRDRLGEYAWYRENSRGETQRVGRKRANAFGLHDMHGNVWEWCLDWHGHYPEGPVTDPEGPRKGKHRVLRGGSWRNGAQSCSSVERLRYSPDVRYNNFGFRIVVEMELEAE